MLAWYLNPLEIMILMFVLTNYWHSNTIRVAKLASCILKNKNCIFLTISARDIYACPFIFFIILTRKIIILEVKMSLQLQYVIKDYININIYIK